MVPVARPGLQQMVKKIIYLNIINLEKVDRKIEGGGGSDKVT